MPKYVDLHNHILPAIDDGPSTMVEAVLLARAFVNAGFDTVVATPHTSDGHPAPEIINTRLRELQSKLDYLSIPLKILPGAEQQIEPDILERLQKSEILTLNNTRYFLLELPFFQPLPQYTEELLFTLVANGYRPVIPHPERISELQKDFNLLYRLHRAGAIYQVTWGALTGLLGNPARETALAMLTANLAHLFSTDAHSADSPLLPVDEAVACFEEEKGLFSAEVMLSTRPRQLLADQILDLPAPKAPTAGSKGKIPFLSRLRRTIGH